MPEKQSTMESSDISNTTIENEEVNSKKFGKINSSNKLQTENIVIKKELERMKRVLL